MGLPKILNNAFVRYVLACTGPVAVRLQYTPNALDQYRASEFLTGSPSGYCVFPGRSRIVRVTREIPHILPPSSLIYSDRFDPANAACGPPASHRSNPVECAFSGGSIEVYGLPRVRPSKPAIGEVLFRRARLHCFGVGTHISRKGSLAVSGNIRAATMPARAAAMR